MIDYTEHRTRLVLNAMYDALVDLEEKGLGSVDEQIGNAIFFKIDDAVISIRVIGVIEEIPNDDESDDER